MPRIVSQFHDELASREAIRHCLYRYARGIDRVDEKLLRSVYWEDAADDHAGMFCGTASEFVEWLMMTLPRMQQTLHIVANVLIEIDGDRADVESYVYTIHQLEREGGIVDAIGAGRYLDRFERRQDEWRIACRVAMVDWMREYDAAPVKAGGPFVIDDAARGTRKPLDRSYGFDLLTRR